MIITARTLNLLTVTSTLNTFKPLSDEAWYLASLHIKSLAPTPITLSAMSLTGKWVQCFMCNWSHYLTVSSARNSCTLCIVFLVLVFGLYLVLLQKIQQSGKTADCPWLASLELLPDRGSFLLFSADVSAWRSLLCVNSDLHEQWYFTGVVGKSFFARRKSEYSFMVPKNCSTV